MAKAIPATKQLEQARRRMRLASPRGMVVDGQDQEEEIAELERMNARLADSLDRCRRILADCQSKLAANANDQPDETGEQSATV